MINLKKNPPCLMLDTETNPRYLMLDTETIYLKKRVYELAFVVFDSVTCEHLHKARFYIRQTVESAVYYFIRNQKNPIFWPNRLNALEVLKHGDCVTWEIAKSQLLGVISRYSVSAIIAHNINFDISAIYSTNNLYTDVTTNEPFLSNIDKLELSGYFIHGLPLMVAYNVPYKVKSGCMTFKADFLVPCLLGNSQNHDALSDCMNQIALFKLTKGKYQNQGSIYGNMLAHHALKHDNKKRLGGSSLE